MEADLSQNEGVRRQHVGVEDETVFLTCQWSSLIRFATTRAALVFGVRGWRTRLPA